MTDWLHWIKTCPSTNRVALDRAADLSHGDAIFTRQQTAGRGQRNRVWQSPEGVITVSFVLHELSLAQLSCLSFSAGLAIIDTIEALIPTLVNDPKLKWPNDILIHDRKVAGILCEMRSSLPQTAVIGIGLNRSVTFEETVLNRFDPTKTRTQPISLHEVAPAVPDDLTLVSELRQRLLDRMAESNPQSIMAQVRSRDALSNRTIEFEHPDGRKTLGIARGISDRGELRIEPFIEPIELLDEIAPLKDGDRIIHQYQSGRVLTWH